MRPKIYHGPHEGETNLASSERTCSLKIAQTTAGRNYGQAQKAWVHNEALQTLDTVACAIVEEPERNDPPASPTEGSSYIIGAAPTGA